MLIRGCHGDVTGKVFRWNNPEEPRTGAEKTVVDRVYWVHSELEYSSPDLVERLSLRFSGGLIKICKFNLLSQFSSFQCPTPPFALLHSKDLSINGFSSACLNKREYIEFLFDTLYLETGRIKKRKVDSSLKRNKNECGLSNPPPMCNR